jgi:phosphopantothenoylcysteine decarboxylase/phosphopantothenate--cysteine ligase
VAIAAKNRGAQVQLIAANCDVSGLTGMDVIKVETTLEMQSALLTNFPSCNILVMSAAVADARPLQVSDQKIKKSALENIELQQNPDLLAELSPNKGDRILVGFAAETKEHLQEARRKLESKGLDVIYVNDVSGGAIFGQDTTMGTILLRNDADIAIKEVSKDALSNVLLDQAIRQLG